MKRRKKNSFKVIIVVLIILILIGGISIKISINLFNSPISALDEIE